jgi:uncharacterized membrane protein YoaK (UPF0700 family)
MSGIVSSMGDNLALCELGLVFSSLASLMSFLCGAATSAILINWGRRLRLHSHYALPLILEAVLLVCFGLLGSNLERYRLLAVPATVSLLCFVMGLQNATVAKISKAEIRTTHVTGLVTDIGIELGKLFYVNVCAAADFEPVKADREKLVLLSSLLCTFFAGGLCGAIGFKQIGYVATVPLALGLLVLAVVPLADDLSGKLRSPQ